MTFVYNFVVDGFSYQAMTLPPLEESDQEWRCRFTTPRVALGQCCPTSLHICRLKHSSRFQCITESVTRGYATRGFSETDIITPSLSGMVAQESVTNHYLRQKVCIGLLQSKIKPQFFDRQSSHLTDAVEHS